MIDPHRDELLAAEVDANELVDIMRRFLRVQTTLVRAFPIHKHDSLKPHLAVRSMLDSQDSSGISWRDKFSGFVEFLLRQCSRQERLNYGKFQAFVAVSHSVGVDVDSLPPAPRASVLQHST